MKRVALGVVVAAVVVAGVSGCGVDKERRDVGYEVGGMVRVLVVDSGTGDVRVTGGGTAVAVTERQEWSGRQPEARHELVDGELTLSYRCPDGDCSVGYEVKVPAGTQVRVKAGTGDVALTGLTGQLWAEAATGGVRAERIGAQKVELKAGTGDVSAAFAVAPEEVKATAGTGTVRLELPKGEEYAVDAKAVTGAVRVDVPQRTAAERKVVARAGTGDVTVGVG
ncbi:DUF4097 family beta strand repeat-containing protein [Kitasatospora sp. NPDC096147]|uniref:DUF4097 family beta strand repeat-containing protein n=1 Tax=Kitasatospora sp. NPDC096147 TaxID=3364093 RepID=UPI0037F2CC5F